MNVPKILVQILSWRSVDAEDLDRSWFPDRFFTSLALFLATVSITISLWWVFTGKMHAGFLLAKDLSIFGTLLISTLYFFLRYRRAAGEIERQRRRYILQLDEIRGLLDQQIETYQQLMTHTSESFHESLHKVANGSIYQHRFKYVTSGLTELLNSSLDRVLTAVRKILESHFRARPLPDSIGLSLSVKAVVTGAMAADLCTLTTNQKAALNPNDPKKTYVITLDRDHETKVSWQEREILKNFYEIDQNTEFARILSGELTDFLHNDLKSSYDKGEYKNSNPDWHKYYNATQIVPIWHRQAGRIFGFLTVDSKNEGRHELFDRDVTLSIMMFGADLLALLFLALDMYDALPGRALSRGQ